MVVGLVAVVAPGSAQGALTLDPGTRLVVECEDKRPFRGEPFRLAESGEGLTLYDRFRRERVYGAAHEQDGVVYADAHVSVRRHHGLRVVRVARLGNPVRWRGC